MSRSFARYAILVLALCLLLPPAYAQYGASLQGTVTDKSGAVVPGANVTITDQATQVTRHTVTSDSGFYRVPALPPGKYTVTVDAKSFGKSTTKDVEVAAESLRGLNVTLSPSAEQQTVDVSAEAVGLETETANTQGTISTRQVERLPTYGRNPYDLLRLAPGVFGDASLSGNGTANWFPNSPGPGQDDQPGIFQNENFVQATANGQRATGNNFMIDGTSVNSLTWGGAAIITPNEESIQEITVVSSTYSAEDGRNSGAQVKVVSKSGTNNFHGSGFFKYDEPGLNAYNTWGGPAPAGSAAPPTTRVDTKARAFGGSIGGPIVKNKLFFFFSYEGDRFANSTVSDQWIETPEFDSLMLSQRSNSLIAQAIGLKNNYPRVLSVIPASCDALAGQWPDYSSCNAIGGRLDVGSPTLAYGQYAPTWTGNTAGNGLDGIPDLQYAAIAMPGYSHGNQYNIRVDYNATSKDLIAFSGYYTPRNDLVAQDNGRPTQDLTFQPRNRYGAVLWNHTFTPTLLNEFRINGTREFVNQYASNSGAYWGLPELQIEMIPNNRIQWGATQGTNSPFMAAQNQFEIRDNVSKLWGHHAFKFGGDWELNQDNNDYEFGSQRPIFVYHGMWNFANGAPIYEGIDADPRTGVPTDVHKYFRQNDWALFFQDDWKITQRLTLNLGLRYEYFAPLTEKYGRLSNLYLDNSAANPLSTATIKTTDQLYPPDRNNFAPRVGFSWAPFSDGKTVIRGGFGVSFNRITDTMTGISRVNPPYLFRYGICCAASLPDLTVNGWMSPPYANGQIDPNVVGTNYQSMYNYAANPALTDNFDPTTGLPLSGQVEIWGAPQDMATPYIYNYSLDFQQELPWNMLLDIGYAGSESKKLLRIVNLDYIYTNNNPHANPVYFPSTSAFGNYNALLVNLNRRFSNGLQFFAKYGWSKSMDTVSGEGAGAFTNQFWPPTQQWDYGPSDFDARHSVMATAIYDLPFFRGQHNFAGNALGGWHIDGTFQFHTGFPWSPVTGNCPPVPSGASPCPQLPTYWNGQGGTNLSNDSFTSGGLFPVPAGETAQQVYFTPASGTAPTGPPFMQRNSFRGPNYQTFDFALGKTATLPWFGGERMQLDFRANMYNAFNRLNLIPFGYNTSSTQITSPTFGQPEGSLAGRVIDFQARFTF